ncbi:hypothetical protein CDA63_11850 [Hymenobacter amundsenii]|uniref:Uncharacterized protein n=1 Tax=Hymenobacter amundsenii TaxID=2006685 RepID=A0A246FK06_9BACT|nr:hypothetical protein [Hymenobacter amundsenii]OWP62905.1 hypothetical protein CDA63_11850 [Hymenobacter amundsenii]
MKNPFNKEDYSADARITSGSDRTEMEQALQEHVYGHRVVNIQMTRKVDPAASLEHGQLVEAVEVSVTMDNGIVHVSRIVVEALSILSRGDGLGRVTES